MSRKLPKLKVRCSSLSEIENLDLDSGFGREISRKSSKESAVKHKISQKAVYKGRHSLGKPAVNVNKTIRRKSFRESGWYLEDENGDDDEGIDYSSNTSTLSPVASQSPFRCIPVIERESSTASSDSGRLSSDVTTIFPAIGPDDSDTQRKQFYDNMNTFVGTCKPNPMLVLNQKEHKGKLETTFTCTIGNKPKDHKHGDILWLNIKAYFSGKDISDCPFEEDKQLFKKREQHWSIIDEIGKYKALPFPSVPHSLEASYMTHIGQVRDQVHSLLERLDRYQAHFPTRKAMMDYISKNRDNGFMHRLADRIDVMTAWLNTVDDLFDKIKLLGELFEVDHLPDATKLWPRPMGPCQISISIKEARPVFKEYVGKNRNLKAMKKVLVRVWDVCETSVVKAALLLGKKVATYAQAASGFKPHLPLTDKQKERYDSYGTSSSPYGCCNYEFIQMELPSFLPVFQFILGVRQELILEWLSIRSNFVGVDEIVDSLTLAAIIEDSRDCLGEAIRVKLHYLGVMHGIGMGTNYSAEFDDCLKDVFRKYLDYVFRWINSFLSIGYSIRLFDDLAREWSEAVHYACSIPSGIVNLTATFSSIINLLIDKLVIEYWERNADSVEEEHSTSDIKMDDEYDREDDRLHNTQSSVLSACREHAKMIRNARDRMKRIFTLLRDTMLKDLNNASAFEVSNYFSANLLANKLKTYFTLVRFGDLDDNRLSMLNVTVCVENRYVDQVEILIRDLCDCRRTEAKGYLLVLPFPDLREKWEGKEVRVNLDDEAIMSFRYIRKDYIFAVGDYAEADSYHALPPVFVKDLPATSSNDNVAGHLEELTRTLVDRCWYLWEQMEKISFVYEHETDVKRYKDSICSTIQQAFDLIFEVHRDVLRIVADSHKNVFGMDLMHKAVELVQKWCVLVHKMKPRPAPHLPVWANVVFNFITYIADPKWTKTVDDETFTRSQFQYFDFDFQQFTKTVEKCKSLIMASADESAAPVGKRTTNTTPIVAKIPKKTFGLLNRRIKMKEGAIKMDEITSRRQRMVFTLGKVIENTSRNRFDLTAHMDSSRKPPFQWQKLEKIGSGTFADVYKALNCDDKCVIAVKKLHVEKKQIPIIEREIEIFSGLKHENLVKYFGFQVIQDDIYILMEYCAEGTLERICREVMDMTLVRMYTNSLLKAIAHLHTQKVVHRDIKPANIFLDLRCRLKLGDFGCSVRLREQDTVRGELAEYAGTPQYMAPEVQTYGGKMEDGHFRGYGRAVDIWSLGCVVLHMVTGRLPWPDCHNSFQITMRVCTGEKPTYPTNPPAILKNFLDSCFENDPQNRKTAEQLLQDAFANVHVDVDTVYSSTNGLPSPSSPSSC